MAKMYKYYILWRLVHITKMLEAKSGKFSQVHELVFEYNAYFFSTVIKITSNRKIYNFYLVFSMSLPHFSQAYRICSK